MDVNGPPPAGRRRRFLKGTALALPAVMTLNTAHAGSLARTSLNCGQPVMHAPCAPLRFDRDDFFRDKVACYDKLVAVTDKRGRVRGYTANGVPTYFEGLRGSDQRACWRYVANGEEVPAAEQPYINAPNNLRTLDPARSRSASACREGYAIVHFSARDGSVLAVGEPHAPVDALVTSLSGACLKSLWGAAV